MNRYNSTTRIESRLPWWRALYKGVQIGSGVLTAACGAMYVMSSMKKKEGN